MAEYIDRAELYRRFYDNGNGIARIHIYEIDLIPPADVEPVVHGWWQGDSMWKRCSVCEKLNYKSNFCPVCGAKMDKEAE